VTDTTEPMELGEGLPELEQLLIDMFPLGLVRQLQQQYGNLGSAQVEDAVAIAVERLVKRLRRGPVRDVRKYLSKIAFNELNRIALRATDLPLDGERDDRPLPSAEEVALRNLAIDIIKEEIRTWENSHIREVTLIYVEATAYGEVLETDEVAEIIRSTLGEEINSLSVRKWRSRGLRKLREFIGENVFDMHGMSHRKGSE
jgi:DNA-directed RNA polymerase specialized sigma24 family protein